MANTLYIHYDPNNGNEAKIFYAVYDPDFALRHSTNIPLNIYEIDGESDNVLLRDDLRTHVSVGDSRVDANGKPKYYFDIALGKIVEREDWEELWNAPAI